MLKRLSRPLSRRVKAGHFAPYDAKRQVEANMNNWRFDRGIISAYAPTQCMPKAPMPSSSGWTRVSGGTHRKMMNRKSKRMEKAGIISAEVAQSQMQKSAPSQCMRKTSVPSSSGGTLIPPAPPSHTEHDVAQMFADDYYCRKSDLHPWFVRGDPVLAEWGGQWHPDGGTYTICQRVDVGHDDSRSKIAQADLPSLRATVASTDREQLEDWDDEKMAAWNALLQKLGCPEFGEEEKEAAWNTIMPWPFRPRV